MLQNDEPIIISTGSSRYENNWKETSVTASWLVDRLSNSQPLPCTHDQFMQLKRRQQDDMKDIGGCVGGKLKDGKRKAANVTARSLIVFDSDNLQAGATVSYLRIINSLDCFSITHSTAKHSPATPRLRTYVIPDREMTPEEFVAVERKLAQMIDPSLKIFDPTTVEPSRLMYWPSHCSDVEPVFQVIDKPFLSVDGMLNLYTQEGLDWHNCQVWPKFPGEGENTQKLAEKQGDPTQKKRHCRCVLPCL